MNLTMMYKKKDQIVEKEFVGSGGIRTHASEETGALNQRLRPLGHPDLLSIRLCLFYRLPHKFPPNLASVKLLHCQLGPLAQLVRASC